MAGSGDAGWALVSILHGAVPLGQAVSFRVREEREIGEIRGLDCIGPAAAPLGAARVRAEVGTLEMNDYVAPGTSASLIATIKEADAGSATITITTMKRTDQEWDQPTFSPHDHRIHFFHEGNMSSTPISVTV